MREAASDRLGKRAAEVTVEGAADLISRVVASGKGRTASKLRSCLRAAYQLAIAARTEDRGDGGGAPRDALGLGLLLGGQCQMQLLRLEQGELRLERRDGDAGRNAGAVVSGVVDKMLTATPPEAVERFQLGDLRRTCETISWA